MSQFRSCKRMNVLIVGKYAVFCLNSGIRTYYCAIDEGVKIIYI